MRISILTLFPSMFEGPLTSSIIGRAIKNHIVSLEYINIRDYASDTYKTVDDRPYGGGLGMILKVDVVDRALKSIVSRCTNPESRKIILLDPHGTPYSQKKAKELGVIDHLILICGHYEGVDNRIRSLVDEEISIGDYVLTGGELPAMVMVDSIVRLLPGVLASEESSVVESFSQENLLEYPQYTRPESYNHMDVPPILLSGDHKKIKSWQQEEAKKITALKRPDILK